MFNNKFITDKLRQSSSSEKFLNCLYDSCDVYSQSQLHGHPIILIDRMITKDEIINVFECHSQATKRIPDPPEIYIQIITKNKVEIKEYFKICEKKEKK